MQAHGRHAGGWTTGTTLIVGMTVAWTLVDLVLFATAESNHAPWAYLVLQAFIVAQFATLAGWLALGDGHLLVRAICVVMAVLLSELVAQVNAGMYRWQQNVGEVGALAAAHIVVLSLPLFVATALGWRCRHYDDATANERPFQFRIAHVLVLMAVVGASLGLWRVLPERIGRVMTVLATAALIISPLVATQWFLQLRPRPRLAWVVALVVLAGYCVASVIFFRGEAWQSMAALALHIAALAANLALFRGWGYRLLRSAEHANLEKK